MKKLVLFTLLLTACAAPQRLPSSPEAAEIRPEAFRAHVEFLASDLLEGREAGTRGYDLAAAYVAAQYELIGLEPAGDNDSYFQSVPLQAAWRDTDQISMTVIQNGSQRNLKFKQDYLVRGTPTAPVSNVEADTVFVGFGIDAPNRNHNDYEGLDVRGKVVVILAGFPDGWPSEEAAYYSSGSNKLKTAGKYGAIGYISVYTDSLEKRAPWSRMTRNTDSMSLSWVDKEGVPHTSASTVTIGGLMSPEASAILFEGAPVSYEAVREEAVKGAPKGFPLPTRLRLQAGNRYESRTSSNVAGVVRGTDPTLRNEYVVISGHLDHLGIGSDVNGDKIYNGALDNAAGVAAMLEAARALKANPPRRSVMFLAVTAEEKGLLGAEYFALNPTVPIDSIVANVNLDMPILTYNFTNVIGFGATHSSLESVMSETLQTMGLGLAPDPFPKEAIFIRSDHYRFVQQGVPSIMLATGTDSTKGKGKGLEVFTKFLGSHYHQPSDDLSGPIDYAAGAKFVEVNYRILQSIANADQRPTWNEGDFFGEIFGR
ncbi:MAG: M28 family metallopeptidase [Gammaproteobacteria bacterium]